MALDERLGEGARGRPLLLHPFFVSIGASLLIAALFTDYMYSSNALMQWANFSAWLIAGGLVLALLAALVLGFELAAKRAGPVRWFDFVMLAFATILSIINVLVHTRDGWTSVVPTGIALSLIVAVLLIVVGIRGWRVTEARRDSVGAEL